MERKKRPFCRCRLSLPNPWYPPRARPQGCRKFLTDHVQGWCPRAEEQKTKVHSRISCSAKPSKPSLSNLAISLCLWPSCIAAPKKFSGCSLCSCCSCRRCTRRRLCSRRNSIYPDSGVPYSAKRTGTRRFFFGRREFFKYVPAVFADEFE